MLAQNLVREVDDLETMTYRKENNIELLGLLTFVDPKHLIRYANDKTPFINEAGMRALGRFDSDAGVPLLIEALQDERARIGIYALRSIFLRMTKSEVLSLLKQAPMKKVTVAKEVIRLVGEIGSTKALQYLLVLEKTDLHKDVRIALLRALWSFLEFDDVWTVFESAAQSSYPAAAKAVCNIPEDGMSSTARRRLLKILLLLLDHPATEVRMEALTRFNYLLIQDTEEILVSRLNELIQSPIGLEVYRAASAFFKTYAKTQAPLIGATFQRVLYDPQSLTRLMGCFMGIAGNNWGVAHYVPASALILETLKRSRLTVSQRLRLIFTSSLSTKERLPSLITDILPELHADALVETENYITRIAKRPGWKSFNDELEQLLAKNSDERARRLAVSLLVAGVDKNKGWSDEERSRLRTYVEDDSVLVAQAAAFVFPPDPEIESESNMEDEGVVMT